MIPAKLLDEGADTHKRVLPQLHSRELPADLVLNVCQEVIDQLIQLRNRTGITAGSKIEILVADHDFYVARINDKCAPRHMPAFWMSGSQHEVQAACHEIDFDIY